MAPPDPPPLHQGMNHVSLSDLPFPKLSRVVVASVLLFGLTGCELFTSTPPAEEDDTPEEPAVDYAALEEPAVKVLREYLGENNFDSRVVFNDEGSVTRVDMTDIEFPNSELHIFTELPNLERVTIWGAGVTDEGMDEVAKLKQISHLTLFNTEITADGLAKLQPLAGNLRMLNLRRSTYLTDDGLAQLSAFEDLAQLDLLYNHFSDEALTHVAKLPKLRVLDLRGCVVITDYGLEKISGMQQLQALKLFNPGVTDQGMNVIGNFKDMKVLFVQNASITDEGLKPLAGMTKLEDLTLYQLFGITDEGLANLSGMNALTSLSLCDNRINGSGLQHLSGAKGLTQLNISETDTNNDGLVHLKDHTSLERLDLWLTPIDDEGLKHLEGLKNLTWLSLAQTNISNDGLESLTKLENLQNLNLQEAKIDDEGLMQLASLKNLTTLNVSGIPKVTNEGIAALKEKLPNLNNVTQ